MLLCLLGESPLLLAVACDYCHVPLTEANGHKLRDRAVDCADLLDVPATSGFERLLNPIGDIDEILDRINCKGMDTNLGHLRNGVFPLRFVSRSMEIDRIKPLTR